MTDEYDPLTGELLPKSSTKPLEANTTDLPEIDITDQSALKTLAMQALVEIVQTAPRNVSLVSAIRELIDRIEGKAPQSIAMTVKQDPVSKLSDDQLAALLANLPDNPMIIPPLPTKTENQ